MAVSATHSGEMATSSNGGNTISLNLQIILIYLLLLPLKLLWFPAYYSTDFDVHRNWLAITTSLPLNKWYTENTSEWTLDYPPFFAWWEYFLGKVLAPIFFKLMDAGASKNSTLQSGSYVGTLPLMLEITKDPYFSQNTLVFQRLTVILSESIYIFGCLSVLGALTVPNARQSSSDTSSSDSKQGQTSSMTGSSRNQQNMVLLRWKKSLAFLIIANPGLLLVDNIHFQYNSMLYGILLLSISQIYRKNYISSAFLFAVVLNFKHIYLYMAPAYFVFLLGAYCFQEVPASKTSTESKSNLPLKKQFSPLNFIKLGLTVIFVFGISLLPFHHSLPQILGRLFPFGRGLTHAYWAPNFWALYSCLDRILVFFLKGKGAGGGGSLTRGIVGDVVFQVLPNVPAFATALLTVLAQLPILWKLFNKPTPRTFVLALTLCGFSSFMFGYHVHEKAILLVLIPFSLFSMDTSRFATTFIVTSISGTFSLFPLLYNPQEFLVKVLVLLLFSMYLFDALHSRLQWYHSIYLYSILPVFFYTSFGHALIFGVERMEFLPLMLMSVYCGVGVTFSYFELYLHCLEPTI